MLIREISEKMIADAMTIVLNDGEYDRRQCYCD